MRGVRSRTRLLIRRARGWVALPYIRDADGKDSTLATGGRRVPVSFKSPDGEAHDIRYAVPNKNQCKECHSLGGEIVPIGPKARNFILDPAASDKLRRLYFENPAALKPVMPQWDDPKAGGVAERARAYLDVSCAHCPQSRGQRVEQRAFPALDRRSGGRQLRYRQAPDRGGARQRGAWTLRSRRAIPITAS